MDTRLTREDLLFSGPDDPDGRLLLAHGAGAAMDSGWMEAVTGRLADRGVQVVRFEFPYMRRRRATGKKAPPDRAPKLLETFRAAIELVGPARELHIGGKSMGGRMASLLAVDLEVRGVVCLGFPFHAPGRPLGDRADHLKTLERRALIVQGERDTMGSKASIAGFSPSPSVELRWVTDGDHSLKPRKGSGVTLEENLDACCGWVAEFLRGSEAAGAR